MLPCLSGWNARSRSCAPTTMSWLARVVALRNSSRRCNCRIWRRRLERDRLQILQLQTEAVTIAILRLVGAMPHHLVDKFLRRFDCFQPILEAVPEGIDLVFVSWQQLVLAEMLHQRRRQARSIVKVAWETFRMSLHRFQRDTDQGDVAP